MAFTSLVGGHHSHTMSSSEPPPHTKQPVDVVCPPRRCQQRCPDTCEVYHDAEIIASAMRLAELCPGPQLQDEMIVSANSLAELCFCPKQPELERSFYDWLFP